MPDRIRQLPDQLGIEIGKIDPAQKIRRIYLAHYDLLTGLPNRALFRDRLLQAMAQAKRSSTLLAVMFLDIEKMFGDIRSSLSSETLATFEDSIMYLEPIQFILIGSSGFKNDVAHTVGIIFIRSQ